MIRTVEKITNRYCEDVLRESMTGGVIYVCDQVQAAIEHFTNMPALRAATENDLDYFASTLEENEI